ncbi:type IV pilin [Halovenus carboxidivorans]|uniref:type IV pilin n=1 Tax=Halovenus carboxidivorans TaxID=2692199 RepID=UPI001F196CA5|nr:type IV pilin N-terminal domain-containing protein [Halovenus carboxidivorans]
MLQDDSSAVSPVIGVILMVAITVILAAVIASFVLGLGDSSNDPAPTPTIDASIENNNLTLDVTGGDDFDASVATIQGTVGGSEVEFDLDAGRANLDEVTAGDTIRINTTDATINGQTVTTSGAVDGSGSTPIEEWEIEIVWNPADQNSEIIYSDSSS